MAKKVRTNALKAWGELAAEFNSKAFRPIYLIYGTEHYFPDRLQRLLVDTALAPPEKDFNLDIVYGADTEASAVLAICHTVPLMADRRVIIVRGFDQLRDNRRFAAYARRPNPTAIVFLACAGNPRFNTDPYRTLKQKAACVEFAPLYPNQVPQFIQGLAKENNCEINSDAAHLLVEFTGTSLSAVANEFNKLRVYAGDRSVITREDVLNASGQTRENNVFEMQDALAEQRPSDAHRIANQLLLGASNQYSESVRIVAFLISYFTKLWKMHGYAHARLTNYKLASLIGVSPGLLARYRQAQRAYPPPALQRAFSALLSADHELKSGSGQPPRVVITLLLNRLLSAPANVPGSV